jgi:hypothetical protein
VSGPELSINPSALVLVSVVCTFVICAFTGLSREIEMGFWWFGWMEHNEKINF